jgi:hypothetical protein
VAKVTLKVLSASDLWKFPCIEVAVCGYEYASRVGAPDAAGNLFDVDVPLSARFDPIGTQDAGAEANSGKNVVFDGEFFPIALDLGALCVGLRPVVIRRKGGLCKRTGQDTWLAQTLYEMINTWYACAGISHLTPG